MTDRVDSVLLKAAIDIGKYYAFLAQALRTVYDAEAAAQLADGDLDVMLNRVRADLAPILEKNHIVQENLERVHREVMRIRRAASDQTIKEAAAAEAKRYEPEILLRARTVSDLVALFRRLA
jgi:hypothetical protein